MKNALRTYSQILQLRGDTIHALLQSEQGIAFAVKLFLIVSLIAGLGMWAGLPSALRTPTLVERFDKVIEQTSETVAAVTAAIESTVAALEGKIAEAADTAAAEFDRRFGGVIAQASSLFERFTNPQTRLGQLLTQRSVTVSAIEGVIAETRGQRARVYPTPELRAQVAASFAFAREWQPVGLPPGYFPLVAGGRDAFVKQGTSIVGHGGIAIEEVIVPLVKFSRRTR